MAQLSHAAASILHHRVIYDMNQAMIHWQVQWRRVVVFFAIGLVLLLLVIPVVNRGKEPPEAHNSGQGRGIPGKIYYQTPSAPADKTSKNAG
jgi:hypothetical protein